MKFIIYLLILLSAVFLSAQPSTITYQGVLTDDNGDVITGTENIKFDIFNEETGGSSIWTETHSSVSVSNGLFNVELGSVNSFGTLDFSQELWLEITVSGNTLSPRIAFNASGYAMESPNYGMNNFTGTNYLYDSKTGVKLTPDNSTYNVDLVLQPKGEGAFLANQPDGTATGGNNRGTYAVDLQLRRESPSQVASGYCSVIGGGRNNTASGIISTIAGGYRNTAAEYESFIGGGEYNRTNGYYSSITGGYGNVADGLASVISGGNYNEATGDKSVVSGGYDNAASGEYSLVGSGYKNIASGEYSVVSGGDQNESIGDYAFTGAGQYNEASGESSFIGSGVWNEATGENATIGGGYSNDADGNYSVISGGSYNESSGLRTSIVGGHLNKATVDYAFVGGGLQNRATAFYATISGGTYNDATSESATVCGGSHNLAEGEYSLVAGRHNTAHDYAETVFGLYATEGTGSSDSYVETDRLFVIGNGTSDIVSYRKNAFTILKNANTTIGGSLTINGNGTDADYTFPTDRGTDGQVLTTDGSGGSSWITPYSGLSYFSESRNTDAPNASVPAYQLAATGTEDNIDLILTPKGTGALLAQLPDGTVTGGNKRGENAVDLQMKRESNNQIAGGKWSTISGGSDNTASGLISTVSGGYSNTASGDYTIVSGGYANTASAFCSTLSGGFDNIVNGSYSTVSGGYVNEASALYSTISGGCSNTTSENFSTVSGGYSNTASAFCSSISGGYGNKAYGSFSTVSGGYENEASGSYSAVLSGTGNTSPSYGEAVIGYYATEYTPDTDGATQVNPTDRLFVIGNGLDINNRRDALLILKNANTTIGGSLTINGNGTDASITFPKSRGSNGQVLTTDGSGGINWATPYSGLSYFSESRNTDAPNASVPAHQLAATGTEDNIDLILTPKGTGALLAQLPDGTVTGGNKRGENAVDLQIAKTANTQVASGDYSTVSGGQNNTASGPRSTVSGGHGNTASGSRSTISGGSINEASGDYSTIGGGNNNEASGSRSTVSGGVFNEASGSRSTVSGGSINEASGDYSMIGGGYNNEASGDYSIAMGQNANATNDYSFAINLNSGTGPDVAANTFRISGATEIGGNVQWTNHSDRRLKKDIVYLDAEDNLSKIMSLNGVRYRWKANDKLLNLGFIAQEVDDVLPEVVRYDEINDIYSMEYSSIIPVLVEGIKEQQQEIELLKEQLEKLKNELATSQNLNQEILNKFVQLTNKLEDIINKEGDTFKKVNNY
jgi:hypothetical protein